MKQRHSARCRTLVERLSRFIDNDLTAAERRAVREHLRRCPCCDDFAESLRRTVRICQDARRQHLPADVRARARARVRQLLASGIPAASKRSR
jgi:anti-sigma factor RsiW